MKFYVDGDNTTEIVARIIIDTFGDRRYHIAIPSSDNMPVVMDVAQEYCPDPDKAQFSVTYTNGDYAKIQVPRSPEWAIVRKPYGVTFVPLRGADTMKPVTPEII